MHGCVGTSDVAGNAITAVKIKDSEVKAAEITTGAVGANEIATDAVGGSELQGVNKLLFGECVLNFASNVGPEGIDSENCLIDGANSDDFAIATLRAPNHGSIDVTFTIPFDCGVTVHFRNHASPRQPLPIGTVAVMVYDK
jgi:hypothetical protein